MLPRMSYSWQSSSAAPAAPAARIDSSIHGGAGARRERRGLQALARRLPRPELSALIALAALLNLWALSRNGFANDYYSAAVRSMSTSWHNFLFASADQSGVMTVDKPPLALWVQALSVRVFGFHSLSMLVPQALMGVASVALCYDLVCRRFGRVGGFVAGLALALTPITVAISRHNNPDALLILCCVAALWCAVRALEDGRTRWVVAAGVCVGLGFDTKMLVALVVVPGIALAYLLVAPRGRLRAVRQLLAGGAVMLLVGGAWPLLVTLTPAADRPWISGTSDNSVWSLIFEYNGVGRVDGQAGGPGAIGGGNTMFGGSTGPLRLLNSALGGQAGWLLGFALVSAIGLLARTRLRRADARSGWLVVVGGAFATTAVLFSFASGIFHPYYVSLLAPFAAALVGAGAAQMLGGGRATRIVAPLALAGGVATELAVLHDYPGQLSWLPPVLIAACVLAGFALVLVRSKRARLVAASVGVAALLLAPSVWAVDTLGHATSGTFPEGGPANLQRSGGGGFGGFGPGIAGASGAGAGRSGAGAAGAEPGASSARSAASGAGASGQASGGQPLFGSGGGGSGSAQTGGGSGSAQAGGAPQEAPAGSGSGAAGPGGPALGEGSNAVRGGGPSATGGFGRGAGGAGGFGGGMPGSPMGNSRTLTQALAYVKQHGGGTIAVSSQSSAASAIIASGAAVAGIGGFSGRESDVSASWLAQRVSSGAIRWVLVEGTGTRGGGRGLPGDTRAGSKAAMAAAAKACKRVTLATSESSSETASGSGAASGSEGTSGLYDCAGRAAALAAA
jgi:4-amino-4-deoxy-L-arabinose transferase-like glycosyltransferase